MAIHSSSLNRFSPGRGFFLAGCCFGRLAEVDGFVGTLANFELSGSSESFANFESGTDSLAFELILANFDAVWLDDCANGR